MCTWQGAEKLSRIKKSRKDSYIYYKFIYGKIDISNHWDEDQIFNKYYEEN